VLRATGDVAASDSRAERYIAEHGNVCWEADVLPAAVIEQALDDEVNSWLDDGRWFVKTDRPLCHDPTN
jgi:hypothetical protein